MAHSIVCGGSTQAQKSSRKAWVPGGRRTRVFSGSDWFEASGRFRAAGRVRWSADIWPSAPLSRCRPVHQWIERVFVSRIGRWSRSRLRGGRIWKSIARVKVNCRKGASESIPAAPAEATRIRKSITVPPGLVPKERASARARRIDPFARRRRRSRSDKPIGRRGTDCGRRHPATVDTVRRRYGRPPRR